MDTGAMELEEKVAAGIGLFREMDGDLLDRLRHLGELDGVLADMTFDAVREAREDLGVSWEAIGEALGISRQTAWERWRHHVQDPPTRHKRSGKTDGSSGWWKMNVAGDHIAACERVLRFGTNKLPGSMRRGDVLLLQANLQGPHDPEGRIKRALIFESVGADDGESLELWGQRWRFVIKASECLPTKPFSLEKLNGLEGVYVKQGMMNHQRILPEDLDLVRLAAGLEDR